MEIAKKQRDKVERGLSLLRFYCSSGGGYGPIEAMATRVLEGLDPGYAGARGLSSLASSAIADEEAEILAAIELAPDEVAQLRGAYVNPVPAPVQGLGGVERAFGPESEREDERIRPPLDT